VGLEGTLDGFHYVYKQITSTSFTLTARLTNLTGPTSARSGLMIREDLSPTSRHASALFRLGVPTGVWSHRRLSPGGATTFAGSGVSAPHWLRLVRSGNSFSTFRSSNGTSWTGVGTPVTITMGSTVYVGLATTSSSNATTATGTLDSLTAP
jgi:hypothetical protein